MLMLKLASTFSLVSPNLSTVFLALLLTTGPEVGRYENNDIAKERAYSYIFILGHLVFELAMQAHQLAPAPQPIGWQKEN